MNKSITVFTDTKGKRQNGFTIVELLIVIVVIAILAAISIVAYNGIQNRANDSSVNADLSTIAKKIELFRADNGRYPTALNTDLVSSDLYKINVSKNAYAVIPQVARYNLAYCTLSPYSSYALISVSKSGKKLYVKDGTVQEYTGANDWAAAINATALISACQSVLAGSSYAGTGYVDPSWQAWVTGG